MRPVVFDLEGTLVDFQWNLDEAESRTVAALVEMGFPEEQFASMNYADTYNAAIESADEHGLEEEAVRRRIDAIYDEFDARALESWSLREGAGEVVRESERAALVTNVGRTATTALLDRKGLSFDVVVTRNDVRLLKPDPTGLTRAATELGGTPLFVGDSVTDVRAGERAGLEVAIVGGGESSGGELDAANPAHRLESLLELRTVL